jgi:hypothetical protein
MSSDIGLTPLGPNPTRVRRRRSNQIAVRTANCPHLFELGVSTSFVPPVNAKTAGLDRQRSEARPAQADLWASTRPRTGSAEGCVRGHGGRSSSDVRDLGFTKVGMPAQSQTGSLFPWQQPGPAPSRKIAKNFRLRDRSHFFHDFLHGLGRIGAFPARVAGSIRRASSDHLKWAESAPLR